MLNGLGILPERCVDRAKKFLYFKAVGGAGQQTLQLCRCLGVMPGIVCGGGGLKLAVQVFGPAVRNLAKDGRCVKKTCEKSAKNCKSKSRPLAHRSPIDRNKVVLKGRETSLL